MEDELTLLIMAAGMGSRYGGMKQVDHVDEEGDKILDFSIYDAVQAGFDKIVLVIKKENVEVFDKEIKDRAGSKVLIEYAFQDLNDIPAGVTPPSGREKPWGTAHAVLSARSSIKGPFAVINADDFYGRDAFLKAAEFLKTAQEGRCAMIAYELMNTLTENGTVSRGVCSVTKDGLLRDITERTRIRKTTDGAEFTEDDGATWTGLDRTAPVSMNFWCFPPGFMTETGSYFERFLNEEVPKNPLKAECYLPSVVSSLISEGKYETAVLKTSGKWHGVTYREDKAEVMAAIRRMKEDGIYPERLWDQ